MTKKMSREARALMLMARALKVLSDTSDEKPVEKARAVDMYQMMDTAFYTLWERGYWLQDAYIENDALFAIASRGAKIWKVRITEEGGQAVLGDAVEVTHTHNFRERSKSRVIVSRNAEGQRTFAVIASTSTLNRVGEIDSRKLFDAMIEKSRNTGKYPYFTIAHQGEMFAIGRATMMFREDYTYINAGYFYDTPLAQAFADSLEREADTDYWGISIAFEADKRPTLYEVAGVSIPVYESGEQIELSLLPESTAASLFTRVYTARTKEPDMASPELRTALTKVLGTSDAAAAMIDQLTRSVDSVNGTIRQEGLIARSTETTPSPAPVQEVKKEEEVDVAKAVEVAVAASEERSRAKIDALEKRIGELTQREAALTEAIGGLTKVLPELIESMKTTARQVAAEEIQKVAEKGALVPRAATTPLPAEGFRPSQGLIPVQPNTTSVADTVRVNMPI